MYTMQFIEDVLASKDRDLSALDWETKTEQFIAGEYYSSQTGDGDNFPGFFVDSLRSRCWAGDNLHIYLSSQWRSSLATLCVNIETGMIRKMSDPQVFNGDWSFMDVENDIVVVGLSSPVCPPHLAVGQLQGDDDAMVWKPLVDASFPSENGDQEPPVFVIMDLQSHTSHRPWDAVELKRHGIVDDRGHGHHSHEHGHQESHDQPQRKSSHKKSMPYEAIFIRPSFGESWPLAVISHGGPHGIASTTWTIDTALLLSLGYAVLKVNYRGSIGFGEASVKSLLGNVGTNEVFDVQHAVTVALKKEPRLDSRRVYCLGGSHGGFITLHLIGQNPDFYRAAVAHNPVINIGAQYHTSDIPDWCIVEALGEEFNPAESISPEIYERMWQKSPIQTVHEVKTPVLFLFGEADIRVPPRHGLDYCRILKQNDVETRVLWYPENDHPINKVDAEADRIVNMVRWLEEHS